MIRRFAFARMFGPRRRLTLEQRDHRDECWLRLRIGMLTMTIFSITVWCSLHWFRP